MPLKENYFYHIYNRGINSDLIFREKTDYKQFLQSYFYYCFLCLDTYAYCLLNNHFHLLVRVRKKKEQKDLFLLHRQHDKKRFQSLKYPAFKYQNSSTQLGHLFNSYTRSFNIRNNVTGPLLEGRFKRIKVTSRLYRTQLICYIHRNPIHHHLVKHYTGYPWSSYIKFINQDFGLINYKEVFAWFDGYDGFLAAHEKMKLKLKPALLLE